jgi:ABC-type transport system involved in multi-copper enzyme maturation permease subunit
VTDISVAPASAAPDPVPADPAYTFQVPLTRRHLVKAELLKVWTTSTWWVLSVLTVLGLAITLLYLSIYVDTVVSVAQGTGEVPVFGQTPETVLVSAAADIYTGGQYIGLLIIMILGVLIVTNEFHHQTATTTFLATPKRTRVVLAKICAIGVMGAILWAVTTVVDLIVGGSLLTADGYGLVLGHWEVDRAILVNLLAYVLWGILGVGLGLMIRSQTAAIVTSTIIYVAGSAVAQALFVLLVATLRADWAIQLQVFLPSVASQIMVSTSTDTFQTAGPDALINYPPWWAGALILIGWGSISAIIGNMVNQSRDIT